MKKKNRVGSKLRNRKAERLRKAQREHELRQHQQQEEQPEQLKRSENLEQRVKLEQLEKLEQSVKLEQPENLEQLPITVPSTSHRPIAQDQETEWFWELPLHVLDTTSEDATPAESTSELQDSENSSADEFYVILETAYQYPPEKTVEYIVDALKPLFMEKLFSALKKVKIPSNWYVCKSRKYVHIIEMAESVSPVIQKSVVIDDNRNVHICVHNKQVRVSNLVSSKVRKMSALSDLQVSQSIDYAVSVILKIVKCLSFSNVCCANFEDCCMKIYFEKIYPAVNTKGYVESDYQEVTRDGCNYSKTVRAHACLLISNEYVRCSECSQLRQSMQLSKFKARLDAPAERFESVNSKVPYCKLTSDQKTSRLHNFKEVCTKQQFMIKQLETRIASLLSEHAVDINEHGTKDLNDLMTSVPTDEVNKFNEFQSLLWKHQLKSCKLKSQSGMRWHPLIVRWCLSMHAKSPAAYKVLRESGFLTLPSQRTLIDYSRFVKTMNGFQVELLRELDKKRQACTEEWQKFVAVVHDEVQIKEDLVFDPSTGDLVGFVNLDGIGNDLLNLEVGTALHGRPLATQMLTVMIRGLTSDILLPIAFFPTTAAPAHNLYTIIWEAIQRVETIGLKVLAIVGDGSAQNRTFFQMHSQKKRSSSLGDICYSALNIYSTEMRHVYFISDVPHLMKAARNCFANSFANKQTRKMCNNDCEISWQFILNLWDSDKEDVRTLAPKLTREHVFLDGCSCTKTKYATQVLSDSVANALELLEIPGSDETVKFIKTMNKFFDCMNVRNVSEGHGEENTILLPYTAPDDARLQWLSTDFLQYFHDWRNWAKQDPGCLTKTEIAQMQLSRQTLDGIFMTVKSFCACCEILLKAGAKYVLSEKFTLDPIEEYFSKLGGAGGSLDSPNVQQFMGNALSLFGNTCITQSKRLAEELPPLSPFKKCKTSAEFDIISD